MDRTNNDIKEQLGGFAARFGPHTIEPATVVSVESDDTITVELSNGNTIEDVRLKSVVKAGGKVIMIPAENSVVLIGKLTNDNEYVVLAVDEVTEVRYEIGGVVYSVDNTGFLLQNGMDTLKNALTLIIEAVQQIAVLYGNNPNYLKLQQASLKINNLLR